MKSWEVWMIVEYEDGVRDESCIKRFRTKMSARWFESWFNWPKAVSIIAYYNSHPNRENARISNAFSEIRRVA